MDRIMDQSEREYMRYLSVSRECRCEKCENLRTDDTSTLPDPRDLREIDIPLMCIGCMTNQSESLRIREEHAKIERIFELRDHLFEWHEDRMIELISTSEIRPEWFITRDHPSKCRFDDRWSTHTRLERIDRCPESSPLGTCPIEDRVDEVFFLSWSFLSF